MTYRRLVAVSVLMALLGYGTFVLYLRFSLTEPIGLGLFILAIMAGSASFFSPCSFSLMVALMGRFSKSDTQNQPSIQASLRTASAMALGATLFFALSGMVLILGGDVLMSSVTFDSVAGRVIRLITGSILITFGFIQLGKLSNPLTAVTSVASPLMRFQARHRNTQPVLGMMVFGFAYPMAGFG